MKLRASFRTASYGVVICWMAFLVARLATYLESLLLHLIAVIIMLGGIAVGIRGVFFLSNRLD